MGGLLAVPVLFYGETWGKDTPIAPAAQEASCRELAMPKPVCVFRPLPLPYSPEHRRAKGVSRPVLGVTMEGEGETTSSKPFKTMGGSH